MVEVMSKLAALVSVVALAAAVAAGPAQAGWGNGDPHHANPQAQDGHGVSGAPAGFGGGGFGTSDVTHTSPQGHDDPSGVNGNQGNDKPCGNAGGGGGEP
jgi:hypothetical protein